MKCIISIVFFCLLYGCFACDSVEGTRGKVEIGARIDTSFIVEQLETIDMQNMMNLTLDSAIKMYGKPLTSYDFSVNNEMNPFRIELYNIYSNDELSRRVVNMKEVTWELDTAYRFTIWYEVLNDSVTVAKDSCLYHKFICF